MKGVFKSAAKKGVKLIARKLLILLAPYLPLILLLLVIFFALAILIAATYSAMAPQSAMTGVDPDPRDRAIIQDYQKNCEKYNVADTYVVNPDDPSRPGGGGEYEPDEKHPFYPGKYSMKTGELVDRFGQDQKLKLTWGQAHGAALFGAYVKGMPEIPADTREKTVKDLHPYFYYKKSEVIVSGKDGTSVYIVYLLVEAYTIQGHFQFHYRWQTRPAGDGGTITEEVPDSVEQILPDKFQRLKDWMKKEYAVSDEGENLETSKQFVWEAAKGFDLRKEWLNWIAGHWGADGSASIITSASVPAEIRSIVEEISKKYGIPQWFILAVIDQESSFDVQADNKMSNPHCYGLMQVSDSNWNTYAPRLGYDKAADRDNPRAQVDVGAYMLYELGLKGTDWNGDWKTSSLPVLVFYGGYGSNVEKGRREYAEFIWAKAERYRDVKSAWPVPGCYTVTTRFLETDGLHPYGHKGIDIAAPAGAAVVSASAGVVAYAGWEDPSDHARGFGKFVIVRDNTHDYYYGHLSEIDVSPGQVLQPGDRVGKVGSTGRSTGPHLHFQVNDITGGMPGSPVDPMLYVSAY